MKSNLITTTLQALKLPLKLLAGLVRQRPKKVKSELEQKQRKHVRNFSIRHYSWQTSLGKKQRKFTKKEKSINMSKYLNPKKRTFAKKPNPVKISEYRRKKHSLTWFIISRLVLPPIFLISFLIFLISQSHNIKSEEVELKQFFLANWKWMIFFLFLVLFGLIVFWLIGKCLEYFKSRD